MRINYLVAVATVLAAGAAVPARADTDLTGKWVGQFSGVQVQFPMQPGPFGVQGADSHKVQAPKFTETTLQIEFETQKQGLAAGTWNAGEFKQRFVCAELNANQWSCVDAGGRASIDIKSASEIKVCYLDNREGAQGAGCALLKKSG